MSLLEIKQVTKLYKTVNGDHIALNNVSLSIEKGEIIGLLGVNGAGKSTLSGILATLHPVTYGDIIYKGSSIYNNIPEFRLKLGYCPQSPNLHPMLSLEDNLILAGKLYGLKDTEIKTRIKQLVKQFGLEQYLNQKAEVLSGGYKQRFMIARSLIHMPEFLILDEPTVGLDPHIRRNLWDLIKSLKQDGITVLLTTHYLDEAEKLSDRVCFLDKGHIKLIDTPSNLITNFNQDNLEDVFLQVIKNEE